MPHSVPNSWIITRKLQKTTVVATAHYIPSLESWGLSVKINGLMVDHRQVHDPEQDLLLAVKAALLYVNEGYGGSEIDGDEEG